MAHRRGNGEGNIRRKNSFWIGELMDGYRADGKRNIVSFRGATKAEIQKQIREYWNRKDAHVVLRPDMTLREWSEMWYADHVTQVARSTYANYRYTLKAIHDGLGSRKLCEVLPIHINGFLDGLMAQDYSLSHIHKCRVMLIQIFDDADRNGLITSNPARKSKKLRDVDGRLSRPRQEKDAYSDEELALLEKGLSDDLLGNSIRLLLSSGIRVQELLALDKEDIAADGSTVRVRKAIQTVGGVPTLGPVKSRSSLRVVPIPAAAREAALYLRQHGGSPCIWSVPGQNPYYSVGSFRRRYYHAIEQIAGVRRLSPHCCRHTYISRLQALGVAVETIARLAGHADVTTTAGYMHISPETLAAAVAVLDGPRVPEAA